MYGSYFEAPLGLPYLSSFLCHMASPLASSFPHFYLRTLRGVCESSAVGLSVCGCVNTPLCLGNQFKTNHSEIGNFKSETVGLTKIF